MAEDTKGKRDRAKKIIAKLHKAYPDAKCSLNYQTPFQLLIATILSAQCTDDRVNIVTADLFRQYKKPEDFLELSQPELESIIRSTGFYRNKSKSVLGTANKLVNEFNSTVPQTMDELLSLPGVARKTANVVLGNAFGIAAGVVVDTHVSRLSQRLGLSENTSPEKIERDLIEIIPKKEWVEYPHLMIYHGRKVCKARGPLCAECVINTLCPSSTV